jgi:Protein of unknown function (DUF2752)
MPRLAAPALAVGAAASAFAFVAAIDPNEPGHYPTCPFLAVTGLACPGCGSLRALHALAQGDVVTATGLNALSVSVLPLLAYLWMRWARRSWRDGSRATAAHPALLWALLFVVLAFWVVRNLPWGSALAP